MDPSMLVLVLVAAGVVGGLIAAVALRLLRRRSSDPARPTVAAPVPEPVGEPQLYIALDTDTLFDLYDQTPGAAVLQRRRHTGSSAAKLGADAGLSVGVERTAGSETEVEYLPVKYATRAVSVVERHLQVSGRITSLDLKAPTDDSPLADLLKALHTGADRIGLTVPDGVEHELRRAWKDQTRLITDSTLESLGPFVRVRAELAVTTNRARGEHVLESVEHEHTGGVRVRVVCPRDHARPSFPTGPCTITATCLGTPTWNSEHGRLDLRLISVYRS